MSINEGFVKDVSAEEKELLLKLDEYLNRVRPEYIKDLGALIAVPSVGAEAEGEYVFGKESAAALEKAIEIGDSYGFKTKNHEYYCASIAYGEKEEEMGIVAHLDVVPAGDGWSYEPYKLTVDNGLLIGRGTEDDKGPAVAGLYALRFFKDHRIELPFTLRLILGGNEERGMNDLPYYAKNYKVPFFSFTPDSSFPVCVGEKGSLKLYVTVCEGSELFESFSGGTVVNAVAGRAKAVLKGLYASKLSEKDGIKVVETDGKTEVEAVGKTAHAAMPEAGLNAIGLLSGYLLTELDGELNDSDRNALEFLSKATSEYLGKTLGIDGADEESGYLTCVGGVIKTEGDKITQTFDIRYPITFNGEELLDKAEATVVSLGFPCERGRNSKPYYFSPEKPEIKALVAAYEAVMDEACVPYTMGGGTYARSFPNTVAFGATIEKYRGLLGEGRGAAHDRDEYLSIAEFENSVKIFVLSVLNVAKIKENQ